MAESDAPARFPMTDIACRDFFSASCAPLSRDFRQQVLCAAENSVKHRFGQFPCERVLLAGVIGCQQGEATSESDLDAVSKARKCDRRRGLRALSQGRRRVTGCGERRRARGRRRRRSGTSTSVPQRLRASHAGPLPEGFDHTLVGDASQCDDDSEVGEQVELAEKKGATVQELLGQRLVLWWRAAKHSRDVAVRKAKSVIPMAGGRLIGKPKSMKRTIEPEAAAIPGEHPPRAIGSMCCRSEPDDKKAGLGITETRNRFCPVLPLTIPGRFSVSCVLSPGDQPGTSRAANDFGRELSECRR